MASLAGGCPPGEQELAVVITPDDWASEISWTLTQGGLTIASGGATGGSLCVPGATCLVFTMHDSYGDGLLGQAGYVVTMDGDTVASGGSAHGNNYAYSQTTELNCPPGFTCNAPLDVALGEHTAPLADTWYLFSAPMSGQYNVSTCGTNSCDTRIWVYDHCAGLVPDQSPAGTMYFADGGCFGGLQAALLANLGEGDQVWIRIGDTGMSCDGSPIEWSVTYVGPIAGCTSINACNFDPLATVDDGSCIPAGDPSCPQAPDLIVDQARLASSLNLASTTVNQGNCYIAEGCLTGYGTREIVRFDTRIANIGDLDYYIGTPSANPDQFETQNCHGHTHYKGYAEYLLFDDMGQELSVGFKNGFCVMDIDCDGGGSGQYGCGNMGISAGCADVYGSGTSCNWIDITGVPDGSYTLVVRTNWDNDPDALGRMESNHVNNWAQVCIHIDRTPTLAVTIVDDCAAYVDCLGQIYGPAQMDCMGVCAGTALIGDLNTDSQQNASDVQEYVAGILGNDLTPLPCNDIDQDGNLTVTDAALMAYCNFWNIYNHPPDSAAVHDHCNFPFNEIINPFDTVTFSIGDVDLAAGWLDIHIRNPHRKVLGYELKLSGLQITSVEGLYDPLEYPVIPGFAFGTGHIMCLSDVDSLIQRGDLAKALCRVHFTNPTDDICIAEVVDVVNENYHNPITRLEQNCLTSTGLSETSRAHGVRVFPNPFSDGTTLTWPHTDTPVQLALLDLQGRVLWQASDADSRGRLTIEGLGLAAGTYHYRLTGGLQATGKLMVVR